MSQTIEEYEDMENIKKETFQRTKKVTKKMVKELMDTQKRPFQIRKITSPEDLAQLIKEV